MSTHHAEAQPLPGRDLSGLITGTDDGRRRWTRPIYFMTEDDISRGQSQTNILTGKPFDAVGQPAKLDR